MTTFNPVTVALYPAETSVDQYSTSLFRMSDGWFICFYRVQNSQAIRSSISADGVSWVTSDSYSWDYDVVNWWATQLPNDNIFMVSGSNAVSFGGYRYTKLTYLGLGLFSSQVYSAGTVLGYYRVCGSVCNRTGYPFVALRQWYTAEVVIDYINEAFDSIANIATMTTTASGMPTAKALFSVGSEIRLIEVYTDGTGLKARYFTTSNYLWPVGIQAGEIFRSDPLNSTHSLAVYQEDANSEAYILLATTAGLYAYDSNLQNERLITSMQVSDVKIGKIGNTLYCIYRNLESPYGFYQSIHHSGTLWGSAVFIDSTNDVNYVNPQICQRNTDSSLYFIFTDTTPASSNIICGSLIPWVPAWYHLMGKYVEPPCGYAGQVISDAIDVSHLNGQVVSIYANGEVLEQQVVVDGTVNVSSEYSLIHIGLPFYSDLETLNIEVPLQEGTMQSKREKISNVTFSFKDTRGGFIGPNEFDLWEAFKIESIRQGSGKNYGDYDLVTDDIRQPLLGQYGNEGHIFFRQSDPLPVTIGAIIPEVDLGNASR